MDVTHGWVVGDVAAPTQVRFVGDDVDSPVDLIADGVTVGDTDHVLLARAGETDGWVIVARLAAVTDTVGYAPIGACLEFYGATAPTGWVFPIGQTLNRADYPLLAEVLAPDASAVFWVSSTTFSLPDRRSTFAAGKASSGWAATLGAEGGSADAVVVQHNHTATTATDQHNHSTKIEGAALTRWVYDTSGDGRISDSIPNNTVLVTGSDTHSHTVTVDNDGVSGTNANLPPFVVCNFIMRAA